jgi:hypothetical protein
MVDISILKILLNKEYYDKYRDKLSVEDFSKDLRGIVRVIDAYYKTDNPDPILKVDSLANLYFSENRKDVEYYQGIFQNIKNNEASPESVNSLVGGMRRVRVLRDLSLNAYEVAEGRGKIEDVLKQLKELDKPDERVDEDEISWITDDLSELLDTSRSVANLRWRLDSLNKSLGSLRKGDFGFIFARPETGKTTFLASEVSFMAEQATQPVVWINNEEQSNKVMLRLYQASLGIDMTQLLIDVPGNQKKFRELTKGNVRLIDAPTISKNQVEQICEKLKPSLIVFDQIDKIKGFDNDREDLRLGSIYIWARELAKAHAPIIGVCQADGSGEGQRWLTMANVANAKTSKQAEADWILGIGKVPEAGYDNLRFMHLSKNKLIGDEDTDPTKRHNRWETLIEPMVARYRDL